MDFDIIVPTFKREHCLHNTLSSIYKQTYSNWRIILVDNYGSDYHIDHPQVDVYVHNQKHSASYARNQGLQHTRGDLVVFFDDDDIMLPDYLDRVSSVFKTHLKAKMVHVWIDANHRSNRLRWATPCGIIRRKYATPTWKNESYLQDQNYYKRLIRQNRWQVGSDIIYLDRILACVGHSNTGGLRDAEGQL